MPTWKPLRAGTPAKGAAVIAFKALVPDCRKVTCVQQNAAIPSSFSANCFSKSPLNCKYQPLGVWYFDEVNGTVKPEEAPR